MQQQEMIRLIDIHLAAEQAADSSAAVSVYTPDVEHDVVGMPDGIAHGKDAVSFRILHVWEFRDGQISRENVWLDGAAIVSQINRRAARKRDDQVSLRALVQRPN
jgi:ketosteroid isomerase-like protein